MDKTEAINKYWELSFEERTKWNEIIREASDLSYKRSRKGLWIFDIEIPEFILVSEYYKMCLFPRGDNWVLHCGERNVKDSYCSSTDGKNYPKPANLNDYEDINNYPTLVSLSDDGKEAEFTSKFCAWILGLLIMRNDKHSLFSEAFQCGGRNYSLDPDIYYYNTNTLDNDLDKLRYEFDKQFPFTTLCLLSMRIKNGKFEIITSPTKIWYWHNFSDKYHDNADVIDIIRRLKKEYSTIKDNDYKHTEETKAEDEAITVEFTKLICDIEGLKLKITNPYDFMRKLNEERNNTKNKK